LKLRRKGILNISWFGKENLIRKGIPDLLYAMRILKDEGVEIQLFLAGLEGDGIEYLFSIIQELKINDRVEYLGKINREEKINLLRTIEIYAQPSHYEGFGLAIAEAMGCGACVITCDVGSVKEVVGDCGIYTRPGDPKELAAAIKKVLHDNNLRTQLQNSGYQRARASFAFNKKLERLQNYLFEVDIS